MKPFLKYLYADVLTRAFTFCSRHRLVRPAVLLFPLYVRKIQGSKTNRRAIRILLIPKEGLNEDVLSSLGSDPRFHVYAVYRKVLKALAAGILHYSIDDNNYGRNEDEAERSKLAYRTYLGSLWDRVLRIIRFDAVLTGNFAYYAERELAAALEERGTPFIALHKENVKTPGRVAFFSHVYRERRGPFLGRKIFVYNDIERQLQVSTGVVDEDRVVITGMPRMDRAHRFRLSGQANACDSRMPQVLFFSFRHRTGLPQLARKERTGSRSGQETIGGGIDELNWNGLFQRYHEAILRLARENPRIRVVVKAKGAARESKALADILGARSLLPSNLEVRVGGDPLQLIAQSRVVCGFNTTALLESMAMGKRVVVPLFDEARDERNRPYLIDLEDAVDVARSPDEMIRLVREYAVSAKSFEPELDSCRIRMLDKWVGNVDGRSGERVREELLSTLSRPVRRSSPHL